MERNMYVHLCLTRITSQANHMLLPERSSVITILKTALQALALAMKLVCHRLSPTSCCQSYQQNSFLPLMDFLCRQNLPCPPFFFNNGNLLTGTSLQTISAFGYFADGVYCQSKQMHGLISKTQALTCLSEDNIRFDCLAIPAFR